MNENNETTRLDPGSLLYGFAARAMQIYSVAELFAQHHDAADEPGPAFGLIADEALKLNGEMFELAGEIKGRPLDRLGVVPVEASGNGASHRVVSVHDDPGGTFEFEPPARQSVTYKELDITEVRGSTLWRVGKDSPRTIDDLRFTAREERADDMPPTLVWWRVTPADTDYSHVHEMHGRALAFEFLDMVNHPERDDVSERTLTCIVRGMAEAGRTDWRQQTIADGFLSTIGEYLLHGTCAR